MCTLSNLLAHPGDKDIGGLASIKKPSGADKIVRKAHIHTQKSQERSVLRHKKKFTTKNILSQMKKQNQKISRTTKSSEPYQTGDFVMYHLSEDWASTVPLL